MKARISIVLLAVTLCAAAPAHAQPADDGVRALLTRIEQVVRAGAPAASFLLLADGANRTRASEFASTELMPDVSRSVAQERDRVPLASGNGYRLMVDVMAEFGSRARVAAWQLDITRAGAPGTDKEWAIADAERISSVENIYRVSLSATKQYSAHDLKISAEDIDLTLSDGSVFVAEIDVAATAVVILGKGTVSFHPAPATEKGQ